MLRALLFVAVFIGAVAIAAALGFERERDDDRLDPAAHRESIQAIESVLYRATPAELDDGERVAAAVQDLAARIGPPDAPYRDRRRALRLYELIGLASGMGDAGYATPDLGLLRIEWEKQRGALFAPAPWLGHPARE